MVCTTLGTTKQALKPSRRSTEINAHVVHAFLAQLRANGTKIVTLFVLFWFKNRAREVTLVYAIQAIRRHY